MNDINLFPAIEPYRTGMLKVSKIHELYFEESGNPHGKPVIFLHGGPGAGTRVVQRQFFDPQFYRIILFDQRGAGKSKPFAELRDNTTWDLVNDIEKLRVFLNIEKWLVFGGSWGSTLALAYAVTHPAAVMGLILRGIFLCRKIEINWFYQEGASFIYPDAWEKYLEPIPQEERDDLVKAYYKRLTGSDEEEKLKAAKAWSIWEASTSKLFQDTSAITEFEDPARALPFSRIECHYMKNLAFFEDDRFILEKAKSINHIPCRIVQGRYDMVCPMKTAWELKKSMPSADLRIIQDAGHSMTEKGIAAELLLATEEFKTLFV